MFPCCTSVPQVIGFRAPDDWACLQTEENGQDGAWIPIGLDFAGCFVLRKWDAGCGGDITSHGVWTIF